LASPVQLPGDYTKACAALQAPIANAATVRYRWRANNNQEADMSPEFLVMALWALFIVSWIAAAVWAHRPTARMALGPLAPLYTAGGAASVLLVALNMGVPYMRGRLWPPLPLLDWAMVVLCALGLAFCWWARIHLGKLWSGGIDRKADHRVVDTGPYGIVRHPIYSGVIVAAFAFAVTRARPSAILLWLLITVFFSLKARMEERFLREELGEDYAAYGAKVGRLMPGVGRVA
jgi:protein-S-isoprenylcysteine O-methyltransferase Ste14